MTLGLGKPHRKRDRERRKLRPPLRSSERSATRASTACQLSAAARAFQILIESRDPPGFIVDSAGIIQAIRIADSEQLKPICAALIGRSLQEIVGQDTYRMLAEVFGRSGNTRKSEDLGCLLDLASGPRRFSVLVRSLRHRYKGKEPFSIFSRDTASSTDSKKRLEKTAGLLAQAEQTAQIGTWVAELHTGELTVSDRFLAIVGQADPASAPVAKLIWGFVRSCCDTPRDGSQEALDIDVPYPHPDGTNRVFQARVIPVPSDTQPLRYIGTLRDITDQRAAEQKLHESRSLLAQAELIANLGSWELDVVSRKVTWSEQLYHLFGFCPWEPAAEHLYWDNLHPGDRVRVREITDQAIQLCREFNYVARYRLPTGQYRVHYTRGIPIRDTDGKTARVIGIVQDITEQTRVEADLHRLSQELMRARDEERRHMARELHESAGQSLAALKMTLGNLREALPKKHSLANSLLQGCLDLTNEAVQEVRTISYVMHPPMLDEAGLPSALRWYARGFSDRSKIQVDVDVPDDFGRQPQEIEMTVFRVIQEALTNVHRYSGSKTARIRLERNATQICAEVQDQGCGLQLMRGSGGQPNGVGIAGMRERIHQLNGVFEIESVPGRGTCVRVILPIAHPTPSAQQMLGENEDRAAAVPVDLREAGR